MSAVLATSEQLPSGLVATWDAAADRHRSALHTSLRIDSDDDYRKVLEIFSKPAAFASDLAPVTVPLADFIICPVAIWTHDARDVGSTLRLVLVAADGIGLVCYGTDPVKGLVDAARQWGADPPWDPPMPVLIEPRLGKGVGGEIAIRLFEG